MWKAEHFEDEPCGGCGVRPSVHQGHGSYSCQSCFQARYCKACDYPLRSYEVDGQHVCPSADVRAKNDHDFAIFMLGCDNELEAIAMEAGELLEQFEWMHLGHHCKFCGSDQSSGHDETCRYLIVMRKLGRRP